MSSTSICSTTNAAIKNSGCRNATNQIENSDNVSSNTLHSMKIKSEHPDDTKIGLGANKSDTDKYSKSNIINDSARGMSCVYNSESPTGKTILITNYSHDGKSANCSLNINNASNKQKSSITIYTHKTSTENVSLPTSSINILINNHYDDGNDVSRGYSDDAPGKSCAYKSTMKQSGNKSNIKVKPTDSKDDKSANECVPVQKSIEATAVNICLNDDVLLHQNNRFYHGIISEIRDDLFLVNLNNNSSRWSKLSDILKLNLAGNQSKCVVCKKSEESPTECRQCRRYYHQQCTTFTKHSENPKNWYCHKCTITRVEYNVGELETSTTISGDKFPYDLNALEWDAHHRQNTAQKYCYCGERGKWFMQMLQCVRCLQWFHEKCVKCLNFPLYYGDCFYLFACANCNHGVEFIRRLHMTIEDVVHLLLFNLTFHFSKRYYNLTNVILPYARDNWQALQLPPKLKNMILRDIKGEISKALGTHINRFKAGAEVKKKVSNWALVTRAPPKAPVIILSPGPPLTEKYINTLFSDQARICYMSQDLHGLSETTFSDSKIEDLMCGKSVAAFINTDEADSADDIVENVLSSISDEDVLADLEVEGKLPNRACEDIDKECKTDKINLDGPLNNLESTHASAESLPNNFKLHKQCNPSNNIKDKSNDASLDINYSSDDTSSRGTLDAIIPPPINFSGMNNPFIAHKNLSFSGNDNLIKSASNKIFKNLNNENNFTKGSAVNSSIQLVRTVKRRLSAQDIIIGPNMEVKRRKLKKRMENVEVIRTSSLADLPKSAVFLPLSADSKRVSIAAIRSTLKDAAHTRQNVIMEPKISDTNDVDEAANTNLISSITSSPAKDSTEKDTIADLHSSLNVYFGGVANRIENGDNFVIKGKRLSLDGRSQYLIEWESVAS